MGKPLFSDDDHTRVLEGLYQSHGRMLRDERFTAEARFEDGAVFVDVTLARADRSCVYEMHSAMPVPESGALTKREVLELCLDFLDWYLGEFFKSERELLLPLDFKPHRFGDVTVHARGELKNEVLDGLADAWLRGERPEPPRGRRGQRRKKPALPEA